MLRVLQTGGVERGRGFELAVARFGSAAGFRNDNHESLRQLTAQTGENVIDAVRIGVVEERNREFVLARISQRMTHELRPERRAANADHEEVFEFSFGAGD